MRGTLGHEVLAGAIGGSAVAGGSVAGPLWATVFDLTSATATALVAVHAVNGTARDRGVSPEVSTRLLRRAARDAARVEGAPLAVHAIDLVCRARSGDTRALRSAANLVGRATTAHARGLVLQLFGSWCAPLRELTQLAAPFAAARAALDGVELIRAMTGAVPIPTPTASTVDSQDDAPPASGRFFVGTPRGAADDAVDAPAEETPWEVAA
jgi:hypothetical protein